VRAVRTRTGKEALRGLLLPFQRRDLTMHHGFNVRGSDKRLYRIMDVRYENNVVVQRDTYLGGETYIGLGNNPIMMDRDEFERLLAQKVYLECNAERFVERSCSIVVWSPVRGEFTGWAHRFVPKHYHDYGGKI
jgi:hypothetical protein